MQVDLEKKMSMVDAFKGIVKLSKKYLDGDSINHLNQYFENLVATDFDDIYLNHVKTGDFINELIVLIPKRIERLLELNAPQVVIDSEIATLESLKKIKQQPSVNRHAKMTHLEG